MSKEIDIWPRAHGYLFVLFFLFIFYNPQAVFSEVYAQTSIAEHEARAHFQDGLDHAIRGNLDQAVYEFQTAIALDPANSFFYYNLGLVLGMEREYVQAIQAFQQTLRLKPDHLPSQFRLGLLYEVIGRNEKALEAYSHVLKLTDRGWEVEIAQQRILLIQNTLDDYQARRQSLQ